MSEAITVQGRTLPLITSRTNNRIAEAAKLSRRKHRERTGTHLVEGQHPVAQAMGDGHVEVVFVVEDRVQEVLGWDGVDDIAVVVVEEHVLERLADTRSPQGMVAVAHQHLVSADEALAGHGVAVLLVEAGDPGNVGGIIRTADAAGASGVILSAGSCDPYNPKAIRAAAGSTTHLDLAMVDDPVEVIAGARRLGRRTVALDGAGDLDLVAAGGHPDGDLLVMGSEAHGLPAEVLAAVDAVGFIPIRGRAESLNLAAATAIALYAVT